MLLQSSMAPAWSVVTPSPASGALSAAAGQCADILGIRQEAEQLAAWRHSGANNPELNELRAHTLRRILQGTVQVQIAENRLQTEQAYTYDVLDRESRKINTVNQLFTIANFLQFGVLYTIEPFSRIQKLFIQSAICTTVGGSIGLALPLANIWYNKHAKAKNLAPPTYMGHLVNGKPVDGSDMPVFVAAYLDSPEQGSNVMRREALNETWKQRYHADMHKKETLCGLDDGKPKSIFVLNSRIVLLWSLYTTIQGFDRELLALLDEVSDYKASQHLLGETKTPPAAVLGSQADEAVRLLNLESVVAELKILNNDPNPSDRKTELRIILMEKILAAYLDMRIGGDRCQEELNYQIDVVLAQMKARKGKFLQKTYEANFLQTNTLGTNAGYQYLRGNGRAGTELFAIANSIGILITTVSLAATHGGWRKNESAPNSLADLFDLRANEKHGFSPLVWNFLNSPGPGTNGKTRREYLQEKWKSDAVSTIDITQKRNQEKLGSMPSCKWDTIKLVSNRIALLSALQEQMGQFDVCLLELLRKAWPETRLASQPGKTNDSFATAAAKVLGVQSLAADSKSDARSRLLLARHVLEGFLEAASDADIIGQEIIVENQVMTRMIRHRDMVIQMTNILNFYQIGILGVTSNSLALSVRKDNVLASNRINIVSGFMVSCFAIAALLERKGGVRTGKVEPNLLRNAFGMKSEYINLSPLMVNYLDTVATGSPSGLSRRQELVKYWEEEKILTVDVRKKSTEEKVAAEGDAHHWWNETIKLIHNRIFMLYNLRAVLRASNVWFDALLNELN